MTLEIDLVERYRSLLTRAQGEGGVATATPNWQEAVARLRAERSQAETCAAVFKKCAAGPALDRGALAYAAAKADHDGTIAGLITALAENKRPTSLPDLEARLRHGFEQRKACCEQAERLIPPEQPATKKGVVGDIVKGAVGPVVEAIAKLVDEAIHGPPGRRDTIKTQLEGAMWLPFASIPPFS